MGLKICFAEAAAIVKRLFAPGPPQHKWDADDERRYERYERYAAAVEKDYPYLNYFQYLELEARSRAVHNLRRKPLPDPRDIR
ncbi:MAG: hypothetical protein ACAH83_00305 [Alphaproteobacteria bacterium]